MFSFCKHVWRHASLDAVCRAWVCWQHVRTSFMMCMTAFVTAELTYTTNHCTALAMPCICPHLCPCLCLCFCLSLCHRMPDVSSKAGWSGCDSDTTCDCRLTMAQMGGDTGARQGYVCLANACTVTCTNTCIDICADSLIY